MVRSESDSHLISGQWPDPPLEYAAKASNVWADPDAIARGSRIWSTHCQSCHGADGQGTGSAVESLSQLPADLSNSFHKGLIHWRQPE